MKEVKNTSGIEVQVQFDGMQIYFQPGEVKSFNEGPAAEIVREGTGLEFVSEIVEAVVEEVAPKVKKEKIVKEEVVKVEEEPKETK